MKISLIIPVYNSEKYIEKLLKTITNQTYKDYEIVIVNDGSNDNSEEIIDKYKSFNLKYKYIENSGPGIARKIGFKIATGDLLFFIDSDDYLPSNDVLESINNLYNIYKFDILLFNFVRKSNDVEKITNVLFNNHLKEGFYDNKFLYNNRVEGALWGKIFVREKFKEEFFCDYKNFEDYYTTYKYLNNCDKIYFTSKVCYYANRDNNDSISKKYDSKKIIDTIDLLKNIYSFSKYKNVVDTIMCNYYTFCKYNIHKFNFSSEENVAIEMKLKELRSYIKLQSLVKVKKSLKCILKLFYIDMKEVIKK